MNHVSDGAFKSINYLIFFRHIWLLVSAISAIALLWTQNYYLNIYLMIVAISCGNCAGILVAVSADLFPTNFK